MSGRDITQVMDEHAEELMSLPGVTGVAIGLLEASVPCIQVLVHELDDNLQKKIPAVIEGHPTVIVVAGEIRGMSEPD